MSLAYQLLLVTAYLTPSLMWAILGYLAWEVARDWPSKRGFFRVLPLLATLGTVNYAYMLVIGLVPPEIHRDPPFVLRAFYAFGNVGMIAFAAVGLHLVRDLPMRADPPRPTWLRVHY